jgi:hypothetical protein
MKDIWYLHILTWVCSVSLPATKCQATAELSVTVACLHLLYSVNKIYLSVIADVMKLIVH